MLFQWIYAKENYKFSNIEYLVDYDNSNIDLLNVSLSISKVINPNLDINYYQKFINKLANSIHNKIKHEKNAREIIRQFSQTVHSEYDITIPVIPSNLSGPEYGMIDFVILKKKGNCLGLVTLYLILADKLNLPLIAKTYGSHIFIVYNDVNTKFYIETTTMGTIHNNLDYLKTHIKNKLFSAGGRDYHIIGKKELIADLLYNSGLILTKKGHSNIAIEAFELAIRFNKYHDDSYRAWGDVLIKDEDYNNAILKFQKAILINPNNSAAYTNMGLALNNLEKFNEAIKYFKVASKLTPRNAYIYLNWGISLLCIENYTQAKQKLYKAKELDEALTPNVERLMKLMN